MAWLLSMRQQKITSMWKTKPQARNKPFWKNDWRVRYLNSNQRTNTEVELVRKLQYTARHTMFMFLWPPRCHFLWGKVLQIRLHLKVLYVKVRLHLKVLHVKVRQHWEVLHVRFHWKVLHVKVRLSMPKSDSTAELLILVKSKSTCTQTRIHRENKQPRWWRNHYWGFYINN